MPNRYWKTDNWNKTQRFKNANNRHPPNLKGKDIGLFYRDRAKKQDNVKKSKDVMTCLKIPPAVISKVNINLQTIAKIAIKSNINVVRPNKDIFNKRKQAKKSSSFLTLDNDGIEICGVNDDIISLLDSEDETDLRLAGAFNKSIPTNQEYSKNIGQEEPSTSASNVYTTGDFIPLSTTQDCPPLSTDSYSKSVNTVPDVPNTPAPCIPLKTGFNSKPTNIVSGNNPPKMDPDSKAKNTLPSHTYIPLSSVHDSKSIKPDPDSEPTKTADCMPVKTDPDSKLTNTSPDCNSLKNDPDSKPTNTAPEYISLKTDPDFKLTNTTPDYISLKTDHDSKPTNTTPDYLPLKRNLGSRPMEACPDFIPISTNEPDYGTDYGTDGRFLNLRGGGDYKYSYDDIITGTFDEKLEECLRKGVTINKCTNDIRHLSSDFYEDYRKMCYKNEYKKCLNFRQMLPTYKKSRDIAETIYKNQVIVISGETGCGKSTQVPQIILDDAITNGKGANVKILVTQPRRIAASSLAARVAQERAERMGNSVGYAVRLEKIDPRSRGSITFCTTGILLAELEVNQGLTHYSHIILDEVHERDCHIDLSMCLLKKVLQKRKDLKLILMSATIDAETLSAYFDDCPMMHIEGLAYPVEDVFMEDILQMTRFQLEEPKQQNAKNKWQRHRKGGQNSSAAAALEYKVEVGPWLNSVKGSLDKGVYQTLQDNRIEILNIDLIYELLFYVCQGPPGAILIFLPGIGEITNLLKKINESRSFPESRYVVFPLHSKLPSLDQQRIFERPPQHMRKIVIATNIAETSITIDDIVYVLDCAKMKITGLNVEENISTLKTEWVSQANMHQRRGRAGRCQPGICYHFMTSYRATQIPERVLPELQRSNLLEPVLTIKRLRLGIAAEALATVPSPPAETTVKWSVKHLQQCGALDNEETLTPLGWHLARLPVHPSAGKLLLLGALFGCLDRAASVAAVWGFKDPFVLVLGKEAEVDMARRRLALGEPSDHVAMSEAIIQWERCPRNRRNGFAYENFLSHNTIQLLSEMKQQLGDSLHQMGFLGSGDVKSAWENRNANNLSLFKAIVAASLYPNIANVKWLDIKQKRRPKQMRIKAFTPAEGNVSVHPSSVMKVSPNYRGPPVQLCSSPGANWLVYWLKQRTSELYLIDVTLVYTLPLLFFGELDVTEPTEDTDSDECVMSMMSTVKVQCKKETAEMLFELRSLLDQVLASKVASRDHSTRQSDFEECVLNTVIDLITAEDEQVDGNSYSDSEHSDYESQPSHSRYH